MLQIKDYSEKAVAVIGDTKEYITELKGAGGRFNPRLTCGPGWIFPKTSIKELESLVSQANGSPAQMQPEEDPLDGARVYVGTYRKYASGSIAGAWLNLKDYKNKSEFYAACKNLHKDEADPEYMFQDYEGIPSWMISESWIDAKVWNQKPEKTMKGLPSKAEIRAALEKVLADKGDLDYYVKKTATVVEDRGRCFLIDKETIETRFCHADEPEDEVREWHKAVRTFAYFKRENVSGIEAQIEHLKNATLGDSCPWKKTYIYKQWNGIWSYYVDLDPEREKWVNSQSPVLMDEETRSKLLHALNLAKIDLEKRLVSWWKQYGPDKLHVWTYWRDA